MSLGGHFRFWAANGPKWPSKNAKMIFSLPDTINYKKKHVGKNYASNPTKLHKSVYFLAKYNFFVSRGWMLVLIVFMITYNKVNRVFWHAHLQLIQRALHWIIVNFHPLEVVSRYRDPQHSSWVKITHICLIWDQTFAKFDVQPFKHSRCIKATFYIPENRPNFPTTKGFRMKISVNLVYQYMAIFFNFSLTSNHLHPLQVENCDSNSRLVLDEDDNGKFRIEKVKHSQ